ncbi:hypothetical protein V3481_003206 [Fusarium oxysporum f. sp. vasinfectum]|uniref:lytic cellulose monooxygenase (C4-dehydrogenating) n=1 Tax=Fusarium oxysporum f. sp. vasinfectum 25433 TaxID=1089449 RepID=X0MKN6_FUSOX|nr:endoglucanase [Fusarium oxysporum f. sp. vasinfectum 25433]
MRDSVTLDMDWLNLYARQARAAANACLDAQIEILKRIGSQVPWSSLPLKTQEILSVNIQGSPDKIKEVTDAVNVLKATNIPSSTPAVTRQAQNAYLTPLSVQPQVAPRSLPSFLNVSNATRQSPLVDRERGLRRSEYAMNSRISLNDDDDDDFEDDSRDAQVARRLQNQEFNQAPAGTLPVRRSTRSTRAVNPVYSAPHDTPSKRKADPAPASEGHSPSNAKKARPSASESDDEYLDEIDNGEPTDSAEDDDAAPVVITKGIVDNGLIRIGPQPMGPQPCIGAAPKEVATYRYHHSLEKNHRVTDSKLPGANSSRNERARVEILSNLGLGMIEFREGWVRSLCDYTGLPILWSSGPRSPSLESLYPVTIFEGALAYHAPPNVCVIMSFLNWAKRRHPIITLPLASVWLNASEDPFDSRKSKWLWAYNALTNTALMHRVFDLGDSHKEQIQKWGRMDASQRRNILEALRTGDMDQFLQLKLQDHDAKLLPHAVWRAMWLPLQNQNLYTELRRIAQSYDITGPEFDYYCTVASPNGEKVFYPFHILSMPQAEQIHWDWHIMHQVVSEMLIRMRSCCNKHAQKAGHAEKHAQTVKVIYWIGAFLCDKIRTLKANMRHATQEEIAFSILDRWGLPIVPWTPHMFRVSLCKKDDHGIAMLFGFADVSDEEFDPVQHIDLSRATVTLDSQLTNMAMRNFSTSDWAGLRETLKCLPLHHPFWRINQSMGNHIWFGRQYQLAFPVPPVPEFETHLLSITAWVDGQPREPFVCSYCLKQFNSAGQLVDHSRKCSVADEKERSYQESTDPEQDAIEEAYFALRCDFEGCLESFAKVSDLIQHKRMHRFPFVCDFEGCTRYFGTQSLYDTHMKSHLPLKCDYMGCVRRFALESELAQHKETHGTSEELELHCPFEDCDKKFARKRALSEHLTRCHSTLEFKCDWNGCYQTFKSRGKLLRHKKRHQDKPHNCVIKGCSSRFRTAEELEVHQRTPHLACKHCGETFGSMYSVKGTSGYMTLETESHKGPVIDYLARCPGDCETVDKNDLEFFKIGQEGLIDMSMHSGKWAADVLVATGFSWTLQIPEALAPGNYVLRHEIIALHGSGQPNGAQNYPQCFNLKVTGDGDLAPDGVKGTQLYKANDPGILFNLYTTPLSYKIPGPTLVPGLPSTVSQRVVAATATSSATVPGQTQASTSSKSSSSTSKGSSTSTSTAVGGDTTLKTSTTSRSSSSSTTKDTPQPTEDDDIICGPATGGLPKYSQCGGKDYTGPTVCQWGSSCKVLNPYYSQCL